MSKIFFYKIYGLCVQSSIEFPFLKFEKTIPDVIIHLKKIETFPQGEIVLNQPYSISLIKYLNNDIVVLLKNKPFLWIKNGKEIIINSELDIDLDSYKFFILNQAMGILLYQRSYLVLHGSAVKINENGVAFIGTSGEGKSTIAALLDRKKYSILTDDVLAIKFENNEALIIPSFPLLRLREDVIKNFNDSKSLFSKVNQKDKYVYQTKRNFSNEPLPLKCIYILKNSNITNIIPLKPQDALIELIKHSYTIRLFDSTDKFRNLYQCNNLVKNVQVKYLERQKTMENLENLFNKIEKDIKN